WAPSRICCPSGANGPLRGATIPISAAPAGAARMRRSARIGWRIRNFMAALYGGTARLKDPAAHPCDACPPLANHYIGRSKGAAVLKKFEIEPKDYRDAMALFAGAVHVVTTDGKAGRRGVTVIAACS